MMTIIMLLMDTVFVSSFELVESLHLFIPPRRLTVMRLQQNNLTNFAGDISYRNTSARDRPYSTPPIIAPPPLGKRSIVMSVSVCVSGSTACLRNP